MDIVITIVIGGLIGWVASILMGTNAQMGIVANVVVGIVGSYVGFWLAPKLGISPESKLAHYAVAVGGAAVLLLALKVLGIFK